MLVEITNVAAFVVPTIWMCIHNPVVCKSKSRASVGLSESGKLKYGKHEFPL